MQQSIEGPVGLRNRHQNVRNKASDQQVVIDLLAQIPQKDGGMQESWTTPPLAGPDGTCPPYVADAILEFQKHWKSQRVLSVADGVVDRDKNTIKLMNRLASGKGGGLPPTPIDPAVLALDIIIRFTGGPGGNRRDEARESSLRQNFNSPAYLRTHKPIEAICYTGFREQEQFVSVAVTDARRRRDETSSGKTIVIGSSAGGVSALKAAVALTDKNIRVDYLAINDAAFLSSKNEVTTKPEVSINLRTVTGGKSLGDGLKENFFQTVGHNWQKDDKSPTGFFSYAEFHGPLPGFINVDLKGRPRVMAVMAAFGVANSTPVPLPIAARDRFAALIHKEAGGEAENLIWPRLVGMIKP